MGTPSLGWAGSYGAAGAAEGLEDLLKRKLNERVQAEQERRARAIEAAEAARLAQAQAQMEQQGSQFNQRLGLDTEELTERRRQFDAGSNQRGLELMKGEAEIMDATRSRADTDALRNDPVYGKVIGLRSAGVPVQAIDPNDPTGETAHARDLERITRSGDQNVRSAREARGSQTQWAMVDGKPQLVTEERIMREGLSPANSRTAPTGAENTALGFFHQGTEAAKNAEAVEDQIANLGLSGQMWAESAPNFLQSKEMQLYRQAQRAFTEARLRKVSGAAIPEHELKKDAQMYFVQPGDAPEVIEQKRADRQAVLDGIQQATGRAFDAFYGEGSGDAYRKTRRSRGNTTGTGESLDTNPPKEAAPVPGKRRFSNVTRQP